MLDKFKIKFYPKDKVRLLIILWCFNAFFVPSATTPIYMTARQQPSEGGDGHISLGPCTWVLNKKCPDANIKFYLYTRNNVKDRQLVHADETWESSNISTSYFDANDPIKIIIHGYNSDMFLQPLIDMKDEYLQRGSYNLFYVDWSDLAPAPCYISAVNNARHSGACIAQLVERILETGADDIHLIGFSLGAHVTNFVATSLPSFQLPRITGLDPAMPLFITASRENKLDETDAKFVDVIHTNALLQGKIERCGHADFYMNGGIVQPGCFSSGNAFACSHHRSPDYYAESIRSYKGFWGWACSSYINYLLGLCPRTNYLVIAGEDCTPNTRGMFLITTNGVAPFANGRWTDAPLGVTKNGLSDLTGPVKKSGDPLLQHLDQWGKLEGSFNNVQNPNPMAFNDLIDAQWDDVMGSALGGADNRLETMRPAVKRRKGTVGVRRKVSLATASPMDSNLEFMEQYKQNLTRGIMSSEVFLLPQVVFNKKN